jgi:hypothetical protein
MRKEVAHGEASLTAADHDHLVSDVGVAEMAAVFRCEALHRPARAARLGDLMTLSSYTGRGYKREPRVMADRMQVGLLASLSSEKRVTAVREAAPTALCR